MDLVEGFTGHADSTDIVWNLSTTPTALRGLVQVRLDEIESLSWRCDSEYARVVLVSPVRDVSLIVGLARAAQGVRPQLPALPPRVVERLEKAGLERAGLVRAGSRNGVETFRRAAAS